jgi:hypothetical protein
MPNIPIRGVQSPLRMPERSTRSVFRRYLSQEKSCISLHHVHFNLHCWTMLTGAIIEVNGFSEARRNFAR